MSPAHCGRQAVASLLALACVSLASNLAIAAPAGAAAPAPRAGMVVARPAAVQPPIAVQRPAPGAIQRPAPPALGHRARPPRPDYGVIGLPATFRPSATWQQQRFRNPSRHGAVPGIIMAPVAAGTYGPSAEPDYDPNLVNAPETEPEPCAAPLVIRIGDAGSHASRVRVVHAQGSPCGTPQVVRYAGPRIVDVAPSVGARRVHTARKPARGIMVVRPHRHH